MQDMYLFTCRRTQFIWKSYWSEQQCFKR